MSKKVITVGLQYCMVKEANAGEAITPGQLIAVNSSGNAVKRTGNYGVTKIAVENDYFGSDIDTAYVANDQVQFVVPQKGTEFYGLVPAAASAIAVGDLLKNSSGNLVKIGASEEGMAVAVALEAIDNSAGGAAVRILAEAL